MKLSKPETVFRIDRFVVPAASEAEFLGAVGATDTVLAKIEGCLQHHVLKQDSASDESTYITVVEWASLAAFQNAREVMAAKHKEMSLNPQVLFKRLRIQAELGNYFPVAGEAA